MRTLAVGDIHGGLKALQQLLKVVHPKNTDTFIFLGDYVDGWSESAQTIDFLIEFSASFQCVFIRGNHDALTYQFLKKGSAPDLWMQHGGASTLKSYDGYSKMSRERHITFFEGMDNYHIDPKNRLFVHAGFSNMHGPQHEYYPNMVYWDRSLWEMVCALDPELKPSEDRYPKRLQLFHEIYIGHTPVTRLGATQPLNFANVWNVDTGAAFKGPLSIVDVTTKEFWQSDPVHTFYPDEKGRN